MTDDLERASRALRQLDDIAGEAFETAERAIAADVADRASSALRPRSSRAARAVKVKVTGSGFDTVARVDAGVHPLAHLIAGGTRPHVIRARGHALPIRRAGSTGGFAQSVRHPGTRPHPFMHEAIDRTDAGRHLERAGEATLDELSARIRRR